MEKSTYRVVVRSGGVGGEEHRERGNEEQREHSRYKDPI